MVKVQANKYIEYSEEFYTSNEHMNICYYMFWYICDIILILKECYLQSIRNCGRININ